MAGGNLRADLTGRDGTVPGHHLKAVLRDGAVPGHHFKAMLRDGTLLSGRRLNNPDRR